MIAMHYGFELPDTFGMRRIRDRVAAKAPAFDRYPGLLLKAFLVNDRTAGDTRNFYGAFYVWNDARRARDFLLGAKFAAVTESFGRPEVRLWPVVELADRDPTSARSATLDIAALPAADWQEDIEGAIRLLTAGHEAAIVALDPERWESVRFDLWRDQPRTLAPTSTARRFEVLHVSQPEPVLAGA